MTNVINESFDTPPYPTELIRKDGSFNYQFTADSGEVYRVQFYPSNGLGTNVRRVYLGHKKGSVFKDVMTKLEDPMRIVATMLASFTEFQATPTGKTTDGFVIDATVKAFGPTIRIIKRLAARNPAIKAKFNVMDTTYTWDTTRSPVWIYRKGSDPAEVFNGKNVDTPMLVDSKAKPTNAGHMAPVAPMPSPVAASVAVTKSPVTKAWLATQDGKMLIGDAMVAMQVGGTYAPLPSSSIYFDERSASMATMPRGKVFPVEVQNPKPGKYNDNYVDGTSFTVTGKGVAPKYNFDERMEFARCVITAEKAFDSSRWPNAKDTPDNAVFGMLPRPKTPMPSGSAATKSITFALRAFRETKLPRSKIESILTNLVVPGNAPAGKPIQSATAKATPLQNLTELQAKWKGSYDGVNFGPVWINVNPVYQENSFMVQWDIVEKRTTLRDMFRGNQSNIIRANDMMSQLKGIAATLGFDTQLDLCTEEDVKSSEALRSSNGDSDYSEYEQELGGGLRVLLKK